MNDERDAYQAYLLRLWRIQCKGRWQWRASIESPYTGERQWFASLEQLFAFLGERCEGQVPDAPEAPGADGARWVHRRANRAGGSEGRGAPKTREERR